MIIKKIIISGIILAAIFLPLFFLLEKNNAAKNPQNITAGTALEARHPGYEFDRGEFFEGDAKGKKNPFRAEGKIKGGIIPHHTLPSFLISGFFSALAKQKPQTLILIGPNHPDAGKPAVLTSRADWETPFGIVKADQEKAKKILASVAAIGEDMAIISKEHSVAAIMPYVKYYLPETKVVPLVLKSAVDFHAAEKIAEQVAEIADENTVVVAAVDFSHYLQADEAAKSDEITEKLIRDFDSAELYRLQPMNNFVDSPPSIALLLEIVKKIGATKTDIWAHTNSGLLEGDFKSGVTSYFVAAFSEKTDEQNTAANILFLGDMMFDRYIRQVGEKKGYDFIFQKTENFLQAADMVVGNLEGPLTGNSSVSVNTEFGARENYIFTFHAEIGSVLQKENVKTLNIGNNHILNFGSAGLAETKNNLEKSGVEYFGDPSDANNVVIKNINGIKIAFLNYNQFSAIGAERVVEKITELKAQTDWVVVYAHWGEEYQLLENEKQRIWAHQFVDAGADLIIGSHPHVVQPVEVYKNKAIFYSLGNFIFDQYFSAGTKIGLVTAVKISREKTEFILRPVSIQENGQVLLADETTTRKLLERLAQDSRVDNSVKNEIMEGRIEITNFQL